MDNNYLDKPAKDKVEFITVPNILKAKVGSGGLSEQIIKRAQELLESHAEDFVPLADVYLMRMKQAIDDARKSEIMEKSDLEDKITNILVPCVQLKANGAMFSYPLVTRIAGRFAQFMELTDRLDDEILDIAQAFHTTIKIVIAGKIKGDGGKQGDALVQELDNACNRYCEKYNVSISQE